MDIKEQIEKIVREVTTNKELMQLFQNEPVKAIEKVVGVDLPDDVVEKIIQGVKAKISAENVADAIGALKKLF